MSSSTADRFHYTLVELANLLVDLNEDVASRSEDGTHPVPPMIATAGVAMLKGADDETKEALLSEFAIHGFPHEESVTNRDVSALADTARGLFACHSDKIPMASLVAPFVDRIIALVEDKETIPRDTLGDIFEFADVLFELAHKECDC